MLDEQLSSRQCCHEITQLQMFKSRNVYAVLEHAGIGGQVWGDDVQVSGGP